MKSISVIFPHQLFADFTMHEGSAELWLVEEYLFFKQYQFHVQKLVYHRATMKVYEKELKDRGFKVNYIQADHPLADTRNWQRRLKEQEVKAIKVVDPCDDYLLSQLRALEGKVQLVVVDSPNFLNTRDELKDFFKPTKKSFFQTSFYKQQRKKRNFLLDEEGEPIGGQWTYDKENRKRYPKGKLPPAVQFPKKDSFWDEAQDYVAEHFITYGSSDGHPIFPYTREEALAWLNTFLEERFHEFGTYEDAILVDHHFLNHSVLTPMLNVGLLNPKEILSAACSFAEKNNVPINSTEGFVRQIAGWREFIRGMYLSKGCYSRSRNYWDAQRRIPPSFYKGTTGIDPVDQTIKKVLKTGYCHHIERLMVLGNFMCLCEFHPDDVYRWFMELFVDAYDWVMVPNVYGMTLFADGGTFATKPYISGANYLRKMGDYKKGKWEEIWNGLFWRFVSTHREFFNKNPRMSMMVRSYEKMGEVKQKEHLWLANNFLNQLDDEFEGK